MLFRSLTTRSACGAAGPAVSRAPASGRGPAGRSGRARPPAGRPPGPRSRCTRRSRWTAGPKMASCTIRLCTIAVERAPFFVQCLRRRIRQTRVEPVIAKAGGNVRMPLGPVVQVLPRQPGELSVSAHLAFVSPHGAFGLPGHRVAARPPRTDRSIRVDRGCCRAYPAASERWRGDGSAVAAKVVG